MCYINIYTHSNVFLFESARSFPSRERGDSGERNSLIKYAIREINFDHGSRRPYLFTWRLIAICEKEKECVCARAPGSSNECARDMSDDNEDYTSSELRYLKIVTTITV